jgi:adenine-specific DNA-methyltransferase
MVSARNGHKSLGSSERKATGAHYTPLELASFVAAQIIEAFQLNDRTTPIRVLDPAVGDGELLNAILDQLPESILKQVLVTGFDTDPIALSAAKQRLCSSFPSAEFNLLNEDFLAFVEKHYLNSFGGLFKSTAPLFHIVIANPPYVRTQVLGAKESQRLSQTFGLTGRIDLYQAFLESIALVLQPNGIAGIICSNRFMTTRSGVTVRQRLSEKFKVIHIWDLGDTRLFEAAVLPAVLLLSKKISPADTTPSRFTSIYTANGPAEIQAGSPIVALNYDGLVTVDERIFRVRHGLLDYLKNPISAWTLSNSDSDDWLKMVTAHTHHTFGDIGKIRVGVKTTADKVFIREDWDSLPPTKRPELLLPLITHYVAERFRVPSDAVCPKILYTHICEIFLRKTIGISICLNIVSQYFAGVGF